MLDEDWNLNDDNDLAAITPTPLVENLPKLTAGCSLADVDCGNFSSEELVAGMFPKGQLSALVGEAGRGKSWVIAAVALTLTSGREFLPTDDYEVKDSGRVLLIETEGRISIYIERIKALGGKLENFIIPDKSLKILSYKSIADRKLVEEIVKNSKLDLIVIDSFAGLSDVDENTSSVMPCMKWLNNLALMSNAAVVFTQLANKSDLKDGRLLLKSIRGYSGIPQLPVSIWAIDIPDSKDDSQKRLYQIKNNSGQLDKTDYVFTLQDSTIKFTEEAIKKQQSKKDKRAEIFESNKDKPNKEIVDLMAKAEPGATIETLRMWVARHRRKRAQQQSAP